MNFEIEIIKFLQAGRNPFFDFSFQMLSFLGSVFGIGFLCVVLFFTKRKILVCYLCSYGVVYGVVSVIKTLVQRVRPYNATDLIFNLGTSTTDFSFPSGHAACATAIAIFFAFMLFCYFKGKGARVMICIGSALYVALVCLSRMYLGKHYLTDVLAGAAISAAVCAIGIFVYLKLQKGRKKHED